MKIAKLFPIDTKNVGGEVYEILVQWLCEINGTQHFDIKAHGQTVRLMAAFEALEKEGTAEAFKKVLYETYYRRSGLALASETRPDASR